MGISAIIAIFSAIVAAIGTGVNLWQQHAANQQNVQMQQDINQQNAQLQENINQQNIQNQQRTLQQQQQFSREAAAQSDAYTRGLYRDLYSPQAKVKQLKQAGLSVGLMYGQGGMGGTSSTTGAMATTPSIQPPIAQAPMMNAPVINPALMNVTDLLKALADIPANIKTEKEIEVMDKQKNLIDKQISQIEAETNTTILSQAGIKLDNDIKELDKKLKEGSLEKSFKILDQQIQQIKITNEKTEEEIKGLKIDNDNKQEMYDLSKKQAAQSIAESISKISLNNANKILAEAKTITEEKVREEIEARCNILILQAEEIQQRIEKGEIELKYYDILKEAEAQIEQLEAKIQTWEFGKREYLIMLAATEKLMNKLF